MELSEEIKSVTLLRESGSFKPHTVFFGAAYVAWTAYVTTIIFDVPFQLIALGTGDLYVSTLFFFFCLTM